MDVDIVAGRVFHPCPQPPSVRPSRCTLPVLACIVGGAALWQELWQRAFASMMGHKGAMGIGQQIDTTDFHVETIDLLSNHVPCAAEVTRVIAIYSALKKHSVLPGW
jgi:hypothetical protein